MLHGANPVLWDPKRTVRWNQDRQREQGGVEWGGYGMLDHTVHPLLHTCCNTYADQQRICELTKQLREMTGREELPVYLCAASCNSNRLFCSVYSYNKIWCYMKYSGCHFSIRLLVLLQFSHPLMRCQLPKHVPSCSAGPVLPVGRTQSQPHLPARLGGMCTCSKREKSCDSHVT